MKWLVKSILLLSLMSCSAQWHLKKAIQKDPMILRKDTLVVTDTIVQPPVVLRDTAILRQHDTIILTKERLSVRIVKVNDTITIDAICDSDTIIRVVEVPYDKIVYVEKKKLIDKIYDIALALLAAFLAFFVVKLIVERK